MMTARASVADVRAWAMTARSATRTASLPKLRQAKVVFRGLTLWLPLFFPTQNGWQKSLIIVTLPLNAWSGFEWLFLMYLREDLCHQLITEKQSESLPLHPELCSHAETDGGDFGWKNGTKRKTQTARESPAAKCQVSSSFDIQKVFPLFPISKTQEVNCSSYPCPCLSFIYFYKKRWLPHKGNCRIIDEKKKKKNLRYPSRIWSDVTDTMHAALAKVC